MQSRGFAATAALDTARAQRDAQRAAAAQARAALSGSIAQQQSLAADRKIGAGAARDRQRTNSADAKPWCGRSKSICAIPKSSRRSSGVVIQRNIELGQTVAASLQAPTLFLIADDLRRMEISANVDETDVGRVRDGQRATFTVNAFPGRTFEGRVKQVRLGSQTVQNVVIYTAIISVENPRHELQPGMTANLRIETERRDDVVRIPNAALRWRPPVAASRCACADRRSPASRAPPQRATPAADAARCRSSSRPYASELDLSSDPAREARRPPRRATSRRSAGSPRNPTRSARRAKFVEMRRGLEASIIELLTPEQQTKFRAIVDALLTHRRDPRGSGGRVYVVGPDGKPQQVGLRLGATDGGVTEVMAGLARARPRSHHRRRTARTGRIAHAAPLRLLSFPRWR